MSLGIVYPLAGRGDMFMSGFALSFELCSHGSILGGRGSGVGVPAQCFTSAAALGERLVCDRWFGPWRGVELPHEVPKIGEWMVYASPLSTASVLSGCLVECSAEFVDGPVPSVDVLSVENSGDCERMEVTFKPADSVSELRCEYLIV